MRLVGALDLARDRCGARGHQGPLVDGLEATALIECTRGGVRLNDVEQRRVVAACFVEGVEQGRRDLWGNQPVSREAPRTLISAQDMTPRRRQFGAVATAETYQASAGTAAADATPTTSPPLTATCVELNR